MSKAADGQARILTPVLRHPWDRRKKGNHILTWSPRPLVDHKIAREHWEPIKRLANTVMARVNATPTMTWGERDADILAFWLGAAQAFKIVGMEALAEDVAKLGVLEITPRGYPAIMELALY